MEIVGGKLHINSGTVVTIGNFDGVHLGHRVLLKVLTEHAKQHGLKSLVYTFLEHPLAVMKKEVRIITNQDQKRRLIAENNVDMIHFADFASVKDLEPEQFVKEVLIDCFHMKMAVIGENNRFGKHSGGDASMLCVLGKKYHFPVHVVPSLTIDGVVCSSSEIRKKIWLGEMERATKLLGMPFSITGTVIDGKQLGRTYGFPTANIKPEPGYVVPKCGVYATNACVDGKKYPAITNVGETSFDKTKIFRIETHILEFCGDLYGHTITIEFLRYMRDISPFSSTLELQEQLKRDKEMRYMEGKI